ncbi:unnamed protein product [Tuber aestivum]|uniref:Uncharacterized protein n=1 Tax=Tuber aestivum TaxID=59557 RepID=A0A292PZC9_9PEZI|nr:unnamed protein product [Tuber aestivum]
MSALTCPNRGKLHEDAESSGSGTGDAELPSEDSVVGRIIKLKRVQHYDMHDLKVVHLTEKVDKGFQEMKDGFKRTDRWMMLLQKAICRATDKYLFILKGGFDSANSAGLIGKKSKESGDPAQRC